MQGIAKILGLNLKDINQPNLVNADSMVIMTSFNIGDFISKENENFEPNVDLEVEISIHNNDLVIKPTMNINFSHIGIHGVAWEMFGNSGYNLKKQQLIIKG